MPYHYKKMKSAGCGCGCIKSVNSRNPTSSNINDPFKVKKPKKDKKTKITFKKPDNKLVPVS